MISFSSDYTTGAHPAILDALLRTNLEPQPGYGSDEYSKSAAKKIREACSAPKAEVFFLAGGTQTNQVVIDMLLAPYEGVIAAETGHIAAHEAGAIERGGHKVLTLPQKDGKICAEDIERMIEAFYEDENHEHMVYPGMVYLSFPTEYGTLYTKRELSAIAAVCHRHHYRIPLFIDGARLGYGLASPACDLTLADIASLADVFYIGGTKVGALCGEAVVFPKGDLPKAKIAQIKQHGALLAKGRLLGVQFDTLFTDGLYFEIGRHAMAMAEKLRALFLEKGYRLFLDSPTNQIFVVLDDGKMQELAAKVSFGYWEKYDEHRTVVRFATSWSTTEEDLAYLASVL